MATGGERARDDAAAFAELRNRLAAAREELKGLQDEANRELFAKNPLARVKAEVKDLEGQFHALTAAENQAAEAAAKLARQKLHGDVTSGRGFDKSAEALSKGLSDGEGSATRIDAALGAGAGAMAWGAEQLKSAAGWAWEKAKEGLEFGIKSSAARAKQKEIFDALTHGQGEIALQVRTQLAGETAQDPAAVGAQMRRLIQAHFNRGETETLIRVAADISEVKEGAGESFLSALEKLEHRGKATERDLRAMAGAGLDLQRVLAELKGEPSESIEAVEARLKRGQVSADAFVGAAVKIARQDFGGLAGKGLDAAVNRAQIGLRGLFSGLDVSPLEEFANRVADVLKSDAGASLKKSITDAGNTVLGLVKNISKEDISSFFSSAAAAAYELSEDIKIARDAAQDLVKAAKEVGLIGESAERVARKHTVEGGGGRDVERYVRPEDEAAVAKAAGQTTGKAYDDGLAQGVRDNAGGPAAAASAAAGGMDAAGRERLKIKSPSRVAEEQGAFYDQGLERGIDRHAGAAEEAARALADRVALAGTPQGRGAPAGASAGAAGIPAGLLGGGAPAITINYSPTFTLQGTVTPETIERARSVLAEHYARDFLPLYRQAQRDAREFANGQG